MHITLLSQHRSIISSHNSIDEKIAPINLVRDCLSKDSGLARAMLSQSSLLYQAHEYPEPLTAIALWQGSYEPYLGNMRGGLYEAYIKSTISTDELEIGTYVLDHSLKQLKGFLAYGLNVPLILLKREDILCLGEEQKPDEIMLTAITQAGEPELTPKTQPAKT